MSPDRSGSERARPLDDVERDSWEGIVRSLGGIGTGPQRHGVQRSSTGLADLLRPRSLVVEGTLLVLFVVLLVPDPARSVLLAVALLLGLPALVIASVWRAADFLERTADRDDGR